MKISEIEEALKFTQASPYGFVNARNKSQRATFLSQNSPHDLTNHQLYVGHSSDTGYAIDQNKDLQNVFSNANIDFTKGKGLGREALIDASKNGATTLDCFDGFLPKYYKKFGFVVTSRLPFDDEYAPPNWNYKDYGRPDVVFMVYRGGPRETIEKRVGRFLPYHAGEGKYYSSYEDAKHEQQTRARMLK